MFENIDWGIVIGIAGVALTVFFGVTQVSKVISKNKNKTTNSHNINIGNNASNISINQTNSHNTKFSNDGKKDGE